MNTMGIAHTYQLYNMHVANYNEILTKFQTKRKKSSVVVKCILDELLLFSQK